MANYNVSQIELPNKDLLIIKDTTARTAAATAQTTADSKVTIVSWDATNKKLTKTINGSTTDIVAGSTILSGLTKAQVTSALGYTPPTEDTNTTYSLTQDSTDKHKFTLSGTDGSSVTVTIPDNNTTYTFAEGTTNGAFTVTPSGKSAQTVKIHGLGNAAYKGISDTYSSTSTDAISGKGVAAALASLPTPMVFKGSLGTGGTITTLPTASASNNGHSYKVITNGTYAGVSAKAGDMFISDGTQWVYIPSADEPSGTVTSVGIANGGGLSVSGSPITTSGTITISHADTSSQASVNNSGRTYIQDITLDTYGHVTGITSATETVVDTNTTYTIGTSGNNITLTPSSGSAQSVTAPYATKALNNKDGESITATYRRLDDPYYDTVYATEEEVGDLIVTGAARFLNTINGSISGNAATATNVAWSGVTGKPTTLGGYGITDAKIANGVITLGSNTITPLTSHQTVSNKGATLAWATTSTIATIGGTDIKVTMPSNPNTNTTYTLGADTKNNKITLTPSSGDVQSITVPYATSAGSAGSATKATQDESGNNIKASYASSISISDHTITLKNKNGVSLGTVTVPDNATDNTKLPLAGGTMTGTPKFATSSISEFSGNVPFILGIEAFADGGAVKWKSSSNVTVGSATNASQLTKASTLDTADKLDAFTGTTLRYATVSGGIVTSSTDGLVMTIPWNEKYGQQIFFDDNSYVMKHRYHNNGTWSDWTSLIDESNINDYTPTKTGTGASGTWGISISGNAATATSATSAKQLSPFASISGSSHADALKTYFDENKSNVPRNQIIDFRSTAYGNSSQYMGYFISGYDTNPYGGFYVAHYNTPYYIGIQSGSYSQSKLGRFPTNPTSGQIIIADGTDGVLKSSGFTIAKSVPSNAEFTDTKYTAGTGLTLSDKQFSVSSANASTIMNLLTTGSSAPTDNDYYIAQYAGGGTSTTSYHRRPHSALWSYIKAKADTTYVNITGDTMSGNLAVTNVLGIAQTAGTSGGISLYGGTSQVDTYGIAFRLTSNKEKHGYVQGDWATYFTMNSGATTRGWVFRTNTTNGNVASISGAGNAVFNGSVTVGGNTTNTSGVRQVYNEETQSLDFVFVA